LGSGEKFFQAPSKGGQAKNLVLMCPQKKALSLLAVAVLLGLGLKGLICTVNKQQYYQERQKHM